MSNINHDTAARLLGIAPGELEGLVKAGAVRRVDRNAYALPVLVQDYIGHLKAEANRLKLAPKQLEISEHIDLSERGVREFLVSAGIDHKVSTLDEIRIAYIRNLRAKASGHQSEDGLDLVRERVLTERVDRELKELQVAEKKSVLINVGELEPQLMNMIGAFRSELLSRDDKLKAEIDALYGIDTDLTLLNEHTRAALSQLSRYDPSGAVADTPLGGSADTAGSFDHDGMGAALSGDESEGIGAAGAI